MPLSQTDPANARRQSLEVNLRARHVEPVMQMRIVRDQLLDLRVGFVDVFGISGQCGPAKWTYTAAEKRSDVFGHETGEIEGTADAGVERHLPDIVAVIEDRQTHGLQT